MGLVYNLEELSDKLNVHPAQIKRWERYFELNKNKLTDRPYSDRSIKFFEKINMLTQRGYDLVMIKKLIHNQKQKRRKSEVLNSNPQLSYELVPIEARNKRYKDEDILNVTNNPESALVLRTLLDELKHYANRTIEAEKKTFLLEQKEGDTQKELEIAKGEIGDLKIQLQGALKRLEDFEEQKDRLNLLEVELRLQNMKKKESGFWSFLK